MDFKKNNNLHNPIVTVNWHESADLEFSINDLEPLCVCRQLVGNVITAFEDALQVRPCPLDLHPDHQHRICNSQLLL